MSEIEDYVAFGEYRIVIKMFGLNSRKEEIQQLDQPDNAIVTVCASRFARSRTNRANPLRGTGLPVKQMLD